MESDPIDFANQASENGQKGALTWFITTQSPNVRPSSLVNSQVKDCGEGQACANKPVGSQVNPQIN